MRHGLLLALCLSATEAVDRYDPSNWKPPTIAGCDQHLRQEFLTPARSWERIDVWVPKAATAPAPCIILWYGGGWGGKVTGGVADHIRPLVERGYAVAMPDYVLGAAQPEPLAQWDGAAAIAWLRANAQRLRIDPERIGAWGFSAGGWLVQGLAPSDARTLVPFHVRDPANRNRSQAGGLVPALDPHPASDQPLRLQAFATDWGAGKIDAKRPGWLTPDDPPLFTCHNDPAGTAPAGVLAYLAAGAPAEWVTLDAPKGTHVPNSATPGKLKDGTATTWAVSVYDFFDRTVKAPTTATAPELAPAGGPVESGDAVAIRCVHGLGSVRYTLDGSDPTPESPTPTGPIPVRPGQTLKAIAVRQGLTPSRVVSAAFTAATGKAPRIDTATRAVATAAGAPFRLELKASDAERWTLCGGQNLAKGPGEGASWLTIDPATGVLSGTPTGPGTCPVIVTASAGTGEAARYDALLLVITVTAPTTP